jgi:hypothetical protein
MKKLLFACSLVALSIGPLHTSNAQILVNWNFDGASPGTQGTIISTSNVASVADVSSTGATGSRQSGGTLTNLPAGGGTGTGLDYIAPYAAGTAGPSPTPSFYGVNGFGTSPVSTSYVSFQLTLNSTIDPIALEGISFNLANSGTSGPRGVEVTYRIGTSGAFTSLGTTAVPNNTANNYGLFTFNLGTPAALAPSDVIEFRLLGYANATGNSIRLDNVSISAAAIPEPSTYLLLGGGLTVLLWLRRRAR